MKKVSRKVEPRNPIYRIWWKEFDYKPKGTDVMYWEVDENDNYCGVLRYRVNILYTIVLLLLLYTVYVVIYCNTGRVVNIQSTGVINLSDGYLSLNMNNNDEECSVYYEVYYNDSILTAGNIEPLSSVGTVKTVLSLSSGDFPVKVIYTTNVNDKIIRTEERMLLHVD